MSEVNDYIIVTKNGYYYGNPKTGLTIYREVAEKFSKANAEAIVKKNEGVYCVAFSEATRLSPCVTDFDVQVNKIIDSGLTRQQLAALHIVILEKFGATLEIFQYLIESLGEPDHYQGNLKDAILRAKEQYNKTSYLFDVETPDNDILVDKM